MGADDGVCDLAPDGAHEFELDELVMHQPGMGLVHKCSWCGGVAYEASAGDDTRRAPL